MDSYRPSAEHFMSAGAQSDEKTPRPDDLPVSQGISRLADHRRIPIMGPREHGGHCEIEFDMV